MVAELIMLRNVIVLRKKAVMVVPFVSLVMEKVEYFKKLFNIYNRNVPIHQRIKVRGFFGENGIPKFIREHILICTIEASKKSTSTSGTTILSLGCIVIDELHMMGDGHRGYLLEILVR